MATSTSKPQRRKVRMWGGFVGDKLDDRPPIDHTKDSTMAIYRTKKWALEDYDDVRPVFVIFPSPRKTRKAKT